MRFVGAVACFIVALDCVSKATGETAQTLIGPDYLWLWWVIAAVWGLNALAFAFGRHA